MTKSIRRATRNGEEYLVECEIRQARKRALSPEAMATQPSRVGEQDRKNNIKARAQMKTHEDRLGISLGLS
jgi:hypothetical protein